MKGDYRFVRASACVFARVAVQSEPSVVSRIEWADDLDVETARAKTAWGSDIESGIAHAMAAHDARGGASQTITILSARYMSADTTGDQMTCAAAIATWKSLGYSETEARIERNGNLWRVIF
jgi:hypothetical protein